MTQFAVHVNPNAATRAGIPFLLDVQADVLSSLGTRLIVPLYAFDAAGRLPITRLTPVLRVQDREVIAMVPEMAGVPRRSLGKRVGDVSAARAELLQAFDLLLTGF